MLCQLSLYLCFSLLSLSPISWMPTVCIRLLSYLGFWSFGVLGFLNSENLISQNCQILQTIWSHDKCCFFKSAKVQYLSNITVFIFGVLEFWSFGISKFRKSHISKFFKLWSDEKYCYYPIVLLSLLLYSIFGHLGFWSLWISKFPILINSEIPTLTILHKSLSSPSSMLLTLIIIFPILTTSSTFNFYSTLYILFS